MQQAVHGTSAEPTYSYITHTQTYSDSLTHSQTHIHWVSSHCLDTSKETKPSHTEGELVPSCHLQTVTMCSSSKPTVSNILPVQEKSNEQMPPEWPPCRMDSVSLVTASHTCTAGGFPIWAVATVLLNLGCWLTVRAMISSVCFR